MEKRKGIIVELKRNYGFIKENSGDNIFFHEVSTISPSFEQLRVGEEVEYIPTRDKRNRAKAIGVIRG